MFSVVARTGAVLKAAPLQEKERTILQSQDERAHTHGKLAQGTAALHCNSSVSSCAQRMLDAVLVFRVGQQLGSCRARYSVAPDTWPAASAVLRSRKSSSSFYLVPGASD